ncbi:c2H2-type domain-containing protein [Trichonephila clavipes]|nr:c2H2-type domain-containing protein [Trichonephila clavipes]
MKDDEPFLENNDAKESWRKKRGKEREWICLYQVGKKKTQLFTSAENSTADPENIFLPPKENESAFQKAYKTFNLPNNDSSLGIKEFLLLRKEETIFIFRNELETYKALKVSKWVHCIYSKATDAGKMIKNVEFKTPNNEVLQETNLARLYDDMSEKIVKESEDFEGRDSGWTLDEILRLEVRTNRYSPFRGSSSFIEVPKQIAETKAIINVINKKDSQCFMWSILAALYPNTSNPNKTSREKQLNSSVGTKQLNSTGENNSTRHERNMNKTTQQNKRKQLNSAAGTNNSTLHCRRPPTTACNRLQLYNRLQPPTTACNHLQPPAPPLQQNRLFLPTYVLDKNEGFSFEKVISFIEKIFACYYLLYFVAFRNFTLYTFQLKICT